MKRAFLPVLLLLLLAASLPVFAQGDLTAEQQDAITVVADAMAALEELNSYSLHSEQLIIQDMEMTMGEQAVTITNDITQTLDFVMMKTEDGYNVSGSMEQETVTESGGQSSTLSLTFELVLVDGEAYMRVSGDAGPMSSMLPEGWVSLDDPALVGNPLLASLNSETIRQLYDQSIPIDEESVLSIEEVESTEIDGQAMRVYELELDPQALAGSGIFDSLSSSMGSNMSPEDAEAMLQDMFEDAQISYTAYVGEDDGLLHQIDSVMSIDAEITIQGITLPLIMTVDGTSVYSGFDEPVTIEAPELGM